MFNNLLRSKCKNYNIKGTNWIESLSFHCTFPPTPNHSISIPSCVFPHLPCTSIVQLLPHCTMHQDHWLYINKWYRDRYIAQMTFTCSHAGSKNFEKYLPSGFLIISNCNAARLQWGSGTFKNFERFIFENTGRKNCGLLSYHIEKKKFIPLFAIILFEKLL